MTCVLCGIILNLENSQFAYIGNDTCNDCIDNATTENLKNFGIPKTMGCGICGHWFYIDDFGNHFPCEEDA